MDTPIAGYRVTKDEVTREWTIGDISVVYVPGEQVALLRSWQGLSLGVGLRMDVAERVRDVLTQILEAEAEK